MKKPYPNLPETYSAKEVCNLLEIDPVRFSRYREALGEQVRPRQWGHCVLFTPEQVEILKAYHAKQPVRERKPFPGLRTSDVARRLDLAPSLIQKYVRDLGLKLEKHNFSHVFTEAAVEEIRQHHERRRARAGFQEITDVAVYQEVRAEVRTALKTARKMVTDLQKAAKKLESSPPAATGFIHGLPHQRFHVRFPIGVILEATGPRTWTASFAEARLAATGRTRRGAIRELRKLISRTLADLLEAPEKDPEVLAVLQELIRVEEKP